MLQWQPLAWVWNPNCHGFGDVTVPARIKRRCRSQYCEQQDLIQVGYSWFPLTVENAASSVSERLLKVWDAVRLCWLIFASIFKTPQKFKQLYITVVINNHKVCILLWFGQYFIQRSLTHLLIFMSYGLVPCQSIFQKLVALDFALLSDTVWALLAWGAVDVNMWHFISQMASCLQCQGLVHLCVSVYGSVTPFISTQLICSNAAESQKSWQKCL